MVTKPPTVQEAFTEWWDDPLKFYARKSPDEQGTAKVGFKAGYRAGREVGRREGYAEALRATDAAVEAMEASRLMPENAATYNVQEIVGARVLASKLRRALESKKK